MCTLRVGGDEFGVDEFLRECPSLDFAMSLPLDSEVVATFYLRLALELSVYAMTVSATTHGDR